MAMSSLRWQYATNESRGGDFGLSSPSVLWASYRLNCCRSLSHLSLGLVILHELSLSTSVHGAKNHPKDLRTTFGSFRSFPFRQQSTVFFFLFFSSFLITHGLQAPILVR